MSWLQIIIIIILALAVGTLMGIIGGGGGGLYVIILIIFFKLSVEKAIGTALTLSSITLLSAAWQYWRKKQVRLDYFIAISVSGLAGVLAGSFIIKFINEIILKIAIIGVFILSGLSSLLKVRAKNIEDKKITKATKKLPILIPLGIVSGFITGALGLSGAVPMTSFLIGILDFSPYLAIGTTILVALVINSAGALFHIVNQNIDLKLLIIFGIGSIVGTFIGVRVAMKINRKVLTIILAVLTIASGIYLAFKK